MDITNPHGNEIGKLTEQLLMHLGFFRLRTSKKDEFTKQTNATLTVMRNGEHWFHTEEQMKFLDEWINKSAR